MSKVIQKVFLCLVLSHINAAMAADYYGYVSNIFVAWGKVYFRIGNGFFNGNASNCATSPDGVMYMLDPSTNFGKILYSHILAAKLSGRRVYINGDTICYPSVYGGNAEGVLGIDLKD